MPRGKAAIPLDLPRPAGLSGGSPQSKQECIADTIRDAILKRLLPGDSPLPSSRTLAARWDVARGTVEAAYDILCDFVLWLPPGLDDAGWVAQARAAGIELQPIRGFCRSARCEAGVVVGYAALTAAHARHGGRVLGQLLAASA
ncbi:hypothetical protein F01_440122 [Burkholderia cenocepacia]|nr:hypothetical protein F01_440122 [Burkholderia cenocepacia]